MTINLEYLSSAPAQAVEEMDALTELSLDDMRKYTGAGTYAHTSVRIPGLDGGEATPLNCNH